MFMSGPVAASDKDAHVEMLPMTAHYTANIDKGLSIDGNATASLTRQSANRWQYRFDVDSFIADIRESARFRWSGQTVSPDTYRYSLEGWMISDRHRSLTFNWADDRVTGRYEGTPVDLSLPENALGPMTYQIQLKQDLKKGLQEMSYQVVAEGRMDDDQFAVRGEEVLDSRLGELNTIKVEKVRAPEKKRETYLWFAPEWDYMLVRLVQVAKDGTRYEVHLTEATVNGETVTARPTP
ncbi:uncharacterized protein DUF3108 [Tamilnaduibacter salinus]|uniref:Uncharacterized protein DUF3108 n=2 Tax=Tamilnaduibacter salinus TaxID=1484056 RepID=A0A2U1CT09_9GAMM|nr:uncharacterized protein DUF3108 [Tamilnaduibacter salinus]